MTGKSINFDNKNIKKIKKAIFIKIKNCSK